MSFPTTLAFELTIWFSGDKGSWNDCHRFPDRPDIETIKALMQDAEQNYFLLYSCDIESRSVSLDYMDASERAASKEIVWQRPS